MDWAHWVSEQKKEKKEICKILCMGEEGIHCFFLFLLKFIYLF